MSSSGQTKESPSELPRLDGSEKLLLTYYGDDFTGSTDVMEALARAGLRTVLFLAPPTEDQLAKFPGLRAFGIAGGSRAMTPVEMERELPPAFEALKASGAPIVHYKICSTFDSAPGVGSIGKAIEIGRRVFGNRPTPLVVGAPMLGRYVVFGNLFARSGLDSEPSRLDRHPTMSRHPVTPMDEADLRLQLGRQTRLPVELVDMLRLEHELSIRGDRSDEAQDSMVQSLLTSAATVEGRTGKIPSAEEKQAPIVLFDTLREAHLSVVGKTVAALAKQVAPLFCAGSSGLEYALAAFWREARAERSLEPTVDVSSTAPNTGYGINRTAEVKQIIAVSGSCSPVTDRQIARAIETGFVEVPCNTSMLAYPKFQTAGVNEAFERARESLASGKNVIFHTARGPDDSRSQEYDKVSRHYGGRSLVEKHEGAGEILGQSLAELLWKVIKAFQLRRAVVCGGDTSTHVARALGIEALEYLAPMAPGSPLCRVHAPGRVVDGCEIVFKGGQVGRDDFFLDVLNGGPS